MHGKGQQFVSDPTLIPWQCSTNPGLEVGWIWWISNTFVLAKELLSFVDEIPQKLALDQAKWHAEWSKIPYCLSTYCSVKLDPLFLDRDGFVTKNCRNTLTSPQGLLCYFLTVTRRGTGFWPASKCACVSMQPPRLPDCLIASAILLSWGCP